MTAYGDKNIVIDALRNRCDSFIEKPFTLEQLLRETERANLNILQNTQLHRLSHLIPSHIHQINNPLMSIMGSAELAMSHINKPADIKKCIQRIIRSAEKISDINRKLIKVGEKTEIRNESVDIKALLYECLGMFKDLLILKNVSVKDEIIQRKMAVKGDKFALEQLFKNLILNAIDAMDGSMEKQLTVKAAMDTTGHAVVVEINDTGCGIPEESIKTLFTPYYTRKQNGTGLGLAVVKTIVEKHRGTITADSQSGNGASFTVTLPTATIPPK
jgi:signal transduction histidine kinase